MRSGGGRTRREALVDFRHRCRRLYHHMSRPGHRPTACARPRPMRRLQSKSEVMRRRGGGGGKTPEKKETTKAGAGGKSNARQKPLQPSKELAAVVGPGALSRAEAVSKVWGYIRAHNLRNQENRREILADDTLSKVFGKDKVTMFEMTSTWLSTSRDRAALAAMLPSRIIRHRPVLPAGIAPQRLCGEPRTMGPQTI